MGWNSKILTSLWGRRFGIELQSSGASGGNQGAVDYLVGPEDLRRTVSTSETTGTNVAAYGISHLPGTSVGSSSVYTIDPPVPGVRKTIRASTQAVTYLKTANSETIVSTQNSSGTTVACSTVGGAFELIGYTTGVWLGFGLTSGTSAKAGSFIVSAST
jgi:hypothetical protein